MIFKGAFMFKIIFKKLEQRIQKLLDVNLDELLYSECLVGYKQQVIMDKEV